ncbi:HotDog domain-containing protein [Stachybotrys elegans]|uniref:HotDog domain-containing protein n=1 Tax=Stachybotrys elegans TaxID=80388 RepID=A0A8K0SJZ4_9HYPO|nr:HotDog domain-containing protein [Stachybotrys elegans]
MTKEAASSNGEWYSRIICPALGLYPPDAPLHVHEEAEAYFRKKPWCNATLEEPGVISLSPSSRNPPGPEADQLFGETLAGPRAFAHILCYFKPDDAAHLRDPARPISRVSALFSLGPGLTGYQRILHGGMTMSIMDETTGFIFEINQALGKQGGAFNSSNVTGSLETKFLKPIPVGQVICATAWIERTDGRKTLVRGKIEDAAGTVLATCSTTWVTLSSRM